MIFSPNKILIYFGAKGWTMVLFLILHPLVGSYQAKSLSVSVPVSLSYLETQMANEVKKRLSTILGIGKMPIKIRKTLSDA